MSYNAEMIQKFSKAKIIPNLHSTKKLKYSPNGKILCLSTPNYLNVYSALQGTLENNLSISSSTFDFSLENNILYANDNKIHHLSLFDSKIVGNFNYHHTKINQIVSNPFDDKFISTSEFNTLIWDLRMSNPTLKIDIKDSIATFINNNFVLNVNSVLKFYDIRSTRGPIKTVDIDLHFYKDMFSTQKYFVITDNFNHFVFSHSGELVFTTRTEGHSSVSVSPDDIFLFCTSSSYIFCYDIISKRRVHTIREKESQMGVIDFNPVYCQFATASSELKFWMPVNK